MFADARKRFDMRQCEGKPFAEVACVVPASVRRMVRAIDVENTVVEMTGVMHAEDGAAAALRLEEGQVAEEDAIVDAFSNGKRGRNLFVDFNLVAAGCGEIAEVSLPHGAPSCVCAEQLALVENSAGEIPFEPSLHEVIGRREASGEFC